MESIPTLYNSQAPQSWEEMRLDRYEKVTPSPLTVYSADRLTPIDLVGIKNHLLKIVHENLTYFWIKLKSVRVHRMWSMKN